MVAYFNRQIAAWMDGTESLDDGAYRAYDVILNLIYLNEGPIVAHESGIAGRCNQHPLKFRRNLEKLIEAGKIYRTADGKLANAKAESVLLSIDKRSRNPRRTPDAPPPVPGGSSGGGSEGVAGGSPGGNDRKPLKSKESESSAPPLDLLDSLDKTLSVANATAKPVKTMTPAEIERKELFDRGKAVLGQAAGGMIQNLMAAKHGNVALARAAIEQASTMDNPRQYIGAIISKGGGSAENRRDDGKSLGGYGGIAARLRRERLNAAVETENAGADAGLDEHGRRRPHA